MEKTKNLLIKNSYKNKKATRSKSTFKKEDENKKDGKKTNSLEKIIDKQKGKKTELNDNFPKNINEFRHIIDTLKINDKDLEWVLNLRTYSKMSEGYPKAGSSNAPNLNNLQPFPKKEVVDINLDGATREIEHLIRKRVGSHANLSQAQFEVNLRNYSSNKSGNNKEWDGTIYTNKNKTMTTFLPPMIKTNVKCFSKLEGNIPRPLEVKFSDIDYLNRKTLLKINNPKNVSGDYLGEHFSLPKYDDNYFNPNFNTTRHILTKTANNSTSKWTCGLRGESIIDLKKNLNKEKNKLKDTKKNNENNEKND